MDFIKYYKKILPIPYIFRWWNRNHLQNKDVTILTMNCFGGIIYHDLNIPFMSPTINIRFENIRHFYKFCANLNYYLEMQLEEMPSDEVYPMAKLGDLVIHLVHYRDFASANAKWEDRKKRINFDKIYVIANDFVTKNEKLTRGEIVAFGNLPYKKIVMTQDDYPDLPFTYYMGDKKLSNIMKTNVITGLRGYEISFNVVNFLNS